MSVLNWYVNRLHVRAVHLGVSDASPPRTSLGGAGSTRLVFSNCRKVFSGLRSEEPSSLNGIKDGTDPGCDSGALGQQPLEVFDWSLSPTSDAITFLLAEKAYCAIFRALYIFKFTVIFFNVFQK